MATKQPNYTTIVQIEEQAQKEGIDNFIKREVQSFKRFENMYGDAIKRRDLFIYWLQARQLRSTQEIAHMYGKRAKSWVTYLKNKGGETS